jgi:hypothetical protein
MLNISVAHYRRLWLHFLKRADKESAERLTAWVAKWVPSAHPVHDSRDAEWTLGGRSWCFDLRPRSGAWLCGHP